MLLEVAFDTHGLAEVPHQCARDHGRAEKKGDPEKSYGPVLWPVAPDFLEYVFIGDRHDVVVISG